MTDISKAGTFRLGDRNVNRMGYGAMQLAGPGVFGPPKDREQAIAVLREAVANGVNHIDTSDYYGPHVTNEIIREALSPYPDDLVLVTKLGARRGEDASWLPALKPDELTAGLHDNLHNLGVEAMEVVNLRIVGSLDAPTEGSIARQASSGTSGLAT
jgi:pyridoxine 4-dehydrogenase